MKIAMLGSAWLAGVVSLVLGPHLSLSVRPVEQVIVIESVADVLNLYTEHPEVYAQNFGDISDTVALQRQVHEILVQAWETSYSDVGKSSPLLDMTGGLDVWDEIRLMRYAPAEEREDLRAMYRLYIDRRNQWELVARSAFARVASSDDAALYTDDFVFYLSARDILLMLPEEYIAAYQNGDPYEVVPASTCIYAEQTQHFISVSERFDDPEMLYMAMTYYLQDPVVLGLLNEHRR